VVETHRRRKRQLVRTPSEFNTVVGGGKRGYGEGRKTSGWGWVRWRIRNLMKRPYNRVEQKEARKLYAGLVLRSTYDSPVRELGGVRIITYGKIRKRRNTKVYEVWGEGQTREGKKTPRLRGDNLKVFGEKKAEWTQREQAQLADNRQTCYAYGAPMKKHKTKSILLREGHSGV